MDDAVVAQDNIKDNGSVRADEIRIIRVTVFVDYDMLCANVFLVGLVKITSVYTVERTFEREKIHTAAGKGKGEQKHRKDNK